MSAPSVPARVLGHFIAPREAPPPPVAEPVVHPTRFAPRAAVLGTPDTAPPVAAALACALRAGHRSPAALVAAWVPDTSCAGAIGHDTPLSLAIAAADGPAASARTAAPPSPGRAPLRSSGAGTPSASRLAARLTARGLPSTARGRLAWLALADHPVAAGLAARRAAAALEVPVVLALAGPRTDALEGLIREQDLAVVVTSDPKGPLARIAVATSPVPAVACPPLPAAARLLAFTGVGGPRLLAEPVRAAARRLVAAPLVEEWSG